VVAALPVYVQVRGAPLLLLPKADEYREAICCGVRAEL
jgi:hypothetical protein